MAAPGYNCVFQAPAMLPLNYEDTVAAHGISWVSNDIYDKPRCVGVPKAVMWADFQTTFTGGSANTWTVAGAADAYGGAGFVDRAGRYKFAVAYRDDATGEIGLQSEAITVDTSNAGANHGIRLVVLYPGYLMHECLALSVVVFRSQKNSDQLFFDRTFPMDAFFNVAVSPLGAISSKYGVQPDTGAADSYRHHVEILLPYTADEDLKKHVGASDIIEQMPMGCKAVRTMRGGWTVYGGALGNAGKNYELFESTLAMRHDTVATPADGGGTDPSYLQPDIVYSRLASNLSANFGYEANFNDWGCGAHGIPPAYEGQFLFSRFLFPYPREAVQINKLINDVTDFTAGAANFRYSRARELRYQVKDTPIYEGLVIDRAPTVGATYLKLPRAEIQISEADHPGVTPPDNTTIISHESGEDVEGIGEGNGQLVVCTRGKTYVIGYADTPIGRSPELASDRLGCIGANTMAEFEFGCAWLSDRGPAAVLGGQVQWIGETIKHFFDGIGSRYKRDSTGMMRHAFTAHDPSRALLYFGLFADRANGTADEFNLNYVGNVISWDLPGTFTQDQAHSRFPCDEILVYSYKVGSWSVWRPPVKLLVKWMSYGIDQQTGTPAMFFLGSDNRIYKMDDDYAQWNAAPIVCHVTADTTGTVIATDGTFGTDITARGVAGNYWNAGMEVLVIGQSNGKPLIKRTTLTSISGANVTLADSVTVEIGDELQIGVRSYSIDTNYLSPKMSETARNGRVGIRYSLDGTSGRTAYVQALATTTQQVNEEPQGKPAILTKRDTGQDDYNYLGASDATLRVMDQGFAQGALQGTNARVSIKVVGGATVRLQDLYAEIA